MSQEIIKELEDSLLNEFTDGLSQQFSNNSNLASLAPTKTASKTADISKAFTFLQYQLEYFVSDKPAACSSSVKFSSVAPAPVFRLFGCTEHSESVLLHVYGFRPYFYLKVNTNGSFDTNVIAVALKNHLNSNLNNNSVLDIELVKRCSIYNYQSDRNQNFFKITVTIPEVINQIKKLFDASKNSLLIDSSKNIYFHVNIFYETNIELELRFITDLNLFGCNWLSLPPGTFSNAAQATSHCVYELNISYTDLVSISYEEKPDIPPLKIFSYDIECKGRLNAFPVASTDPVIQIAVVLFKYNNKNEKVDDIEKYANRNYYKQVFTLNSCDKIHGTKVVSFDKEQDLLMAFSQFLRSSDPDIVTGYNIGNFDNPYLIDRGNALNLPGEFFHFGRLINEKSSVKQKTFQNKAFGKRVNKVVNMSGRLQMDVFQVVMREHKLRSYTLNNVSSVFLNMQKDDVHYSQISLLQDGDSYTRRRLAKYCLQDALLPALLMEKLQLIVNFVEMSRVTSLPISYILNRGQQIKVFCLLLKFAILDNYVIPAVETNMTDDEFEGATVIEPTRGFYNLPIATLDFNSLYPSIMIAHNLCYTTLVSKKEVLDNNQNTTIFRSPQNHSFVKKEKMEGILPKILKNLLQSRKNVKKMLNTVSDISMKNVLNGRQLALKITANSVYGFTGAKVGKLPCLEISSSVTSIGREMIEKTKQLVEQKYNNSQVIYGDTDSVMIKFSFEAQEQDNTLFKKVIQLSKEAAAYVTSHFEKPINLEFEKVYWPFLLINKKRYAGVLHSDENDIHSNKLDYKGIETVRRDNCSLVAGLMDSCLKKMLIQKDPQDALNYAKEKIADLLCNRVDISELIITKELTKTSNEYAAKQAHVELAEKLKKRNEGYQPKLGDRIPYVIIAGAKGSAAYTRAEDPLYTMENDLPIDTKYYLENQLLKPLSRIFDPVTNNKTAEILFKGEHTNVRNSSVAAAAAKSSGNKMFGFVQVRESCISCKAALKSDQSGAICDYCRKDLNQIYEKELLQLRVYERKTASLWTECQRCQGSVMEEVICNNRDCPIFYMRRKAQKDLESQHKLVRRFS